jgi:hypothetical protein
MTWKGGTFARAATPSRVEEDGGSTANGSTDDWFIVTA